MPEAEFQEIRVSQGSSAQLVAQKATKIIEEGQAVNICNESDICQKTIAVVELIKRTLQQKSIAYYQYNRLEIANEIYVDDETQTVLDKKKLHHRDPALTICLSPREVNNFGVEWTAQASD